MTLSCVDVAPDGAVVGVASDRDVKLDNHAAPEAKVPFDTMEDAISILKQTMANRQIDLGKSPAIMIDTFTFERHLEPVTSQSRPAPVSTVGSLSFVTLPCSRPPTKDSLAKLHDNREGVMPYMYVYRHHTNTSQHRTHANGCRPSLID
eukprot:GHVU01211521.1.p1 GENE.GHVU01211521.1~~GHVU01211521.1.p1  ORF type:complete len:149 (-),score=9.49 GHVU01211521.1:1235-1681(-)